MRVQSLVVIVVDIFVDVAVVSHSNRTDANRSMNQPPRPQAIPMNVLALEKCFKLLDLKPHIYQRRENQGK